MGYIKEPKGVDLVIGPSVLTEKDKKIISEIIAEYKRTGKLPAKTQSAGVRERTTLRTPKKKNFPSSMSLS